MNILEKAYALLPKMADDIEADAQQKLSFSCSNPLERSRENRVHCWWIPSLAESRKQIDPSIRHLEKIKIRALLVYGTVFCVAPRVTYNEYAPLGTP